MVTTWRFWLVTVMPMIACAGEPFIGQEQSFELAPPVVGQSGSPMKPLPPVAVVGGQPSESNPEAGAAGTVSGEIPVTAGMGGESPIPEKWFCRLADALCQCYANDNGFEPGFFNTETCPASNYCTERGTDACVCWESKEKYDAMLNNGFVAVVQCP